MREFIIGGARSGKSALALSRARESGKHVVFIATATPSDPEMHERISKHRSERPAEWKTIEADVDLGEVIVASMQDDTLLIVDCLTLWLSNALFDRHRAYEVDEAAFAQRRDELIRAVRTVTCDAIFVSNEVGWSVVPENAVARRFRDEQGRLNQHIAALCERVTLVTAGLPLTLKPQSANARSP
jgi:adenosylcobinamide kinase/adenosylcobinamide-phosphate guanylyltransferase